MDMLNILKNFDDASNGKKPSAGAKDVSDMKTILESFNAVEECGAMPANPPSSMPEPDKVTMNVNLNARGIDAIEDLVKLMGGKAGGQMEPDGDEMPTLTVPMGKKEVGPPEPSMGDLIRMASDKDEPKKLTMDDEDMEEEWDNSPEEEYADHDTMIHDLSGGINREKKQYKAAQPGDNAMAVESIKTQLWAALNEKKAKPDYLDFDGDGNKKEPMKKALKDKKKVDEKKKCKSKMKEGAKPDYLDFDKDGNKKEPMKKALKDKAKKKTNESRLDERHSPIIHWDKEKKTGKGTFVGVELADGSMTYMPVAVDGTPIYKGQIYDAFHAAELRGVGFGIPADAKAYSDKAGDMPEGTYKKVGSRWVTVDQATNWGTAHKGDFYTDRAEGQEGLSYAEWKQSAEVRDIKHDLKMLAYQFYKVDAEDKLEWREAIRTVNRAYRGDKEAYQKMTQMVNQGTDIQVMIAAAGLRGAREVRQLALDDRLARAAQDRNYAYRMARDEKAEWEAYAQKWDQEFNPKASTGPSGSGGRQTDDEEVLRIR